MKRIIITCLILYSITILQAFSDEGLSSSLAPQLINETNNQNVIKNETIPEFVDLPVSNGKTGIKKQIDIQLKSVNNYIENKAPSINTSEAVKTNEKDDVATKTELGDKSENKQNITEPVNKEFIIIQQPKIEFNDKVLNPSLSSTMLPPDVTVYTQTQRYINAIDPKPVDGNTSYYPGLRGPNQLIVYTPSYGYRTGTNEFGTEAIVENNMVVRMNGADSFIPQNGFVISGHGNAKKWITNNLQVGSEVYIDFYSKLLRVYLTPDSLIYAAKAKINDVDEIINYYKNLSAFYDDKKARSYLDESKNLLKKAEKKPDQIQEYIATAMESLDNALKNAIPYSKNELKGVWLRPVERSPEQITQTLDKLNSYGITDIFLETYYHGKTIYPSAFLKGLGITYQREEFMGFDPLAVWIDEAHKRNMKVHIWFESFYVGNDNPSSKYTHVLNVHPEWTNKRYSNYAIEKPMPSVSEHNGYFLDPANYQVQSYLLNIIDEIVTKYHPDGINLDYIRYPQTVDPSYSNYVSSNWGYTDTARSEFKLLYDVDPIDIKYGTPEWVLWDAYRQDKVTNFLKNVKIITDDKNVMLTAVVFPDLAKSKSTKMQNWKVWSDCKYVDGLTPLLLTGDKNTAVNILKDVFNNIDKSTKVYPGLFVTFMGGSFEDLLMQIQKTREFKSKGVILFDYAHFANKYAEALTTRVYNKSYDNKQKEFSVKAPKDYKPTVKYKDKKSKKKQYDDYM